MARESYLRQSTTVFSLVIFIYSRVFLIYGLFNRVVSDLVQIASNYTLVREQRHGEDVKI